MSIPVTFDVRLARDLAMQIDGCEFRTVKQYFRSPSSEIRMVVLVEPAFALEEVAAVFAAASMNNGDTTLQALLAVGVLKFGVDDLRGVQPGHEQHVMPLDHIADTRACRVIYLPPCYVVQLGRWTADGHAATEGTDE